MLGLRRSLERGAGGVEKKSLKITAFDGEIVLGPGKGICPFFLSNDRSYLLLFF